MSQYRVKVEVPYEVPCGTCDRSIQVRGDKTRTYRYRSGQSQLYCNLKCSSASKVGVKNPALSERMKGNSYSVGKVPANKLKVTSPRFFQTIDTEEKAYYLGLLAADGCVKHLDKNVGLKSKGTFQHGAITRFKRSCKQAQNILEYLYKDSSVFFGRKNQKYLDWLEYRSIPQ